MTNQENLVDLGTFKHQKSQTQRIRQYKDYLLLLDGGELITEAKGFISGMSEMGLQEDCALKGKAIINELISRVKEGKFQAGLELLKLQEELAEGIKKL